jgi:hypothetical protein
MRDGAKGAFSAGPPVCIPNSRPSQAKFSKSTPMSLSCDLFCEGSQKRHPCALGFDNLTHNFRCLGIVFAVFL